MTYKQLEVRWVDLEPTRGAETQKQRPCVILQCDLVNTKSRTVIIAPLLPNHKSWPFAVNIGRQHDPVCLFEILRRVEDLSDLV